MGRGVVPTRKKAAQARRVAASSATASGLPTNTSSGKNLQFTVHCGCVTGVIGQREEGREGGLKRGIKK